MIPLKTLAPKQGALNHRRKVNTMKTIDTPPSVDALITQWQAAKKAETDWIEYRRYLEQQIQEQLPDAFTELKESMTGLSASAKLGAIEVQASREFETDQAEAALLIGLYPNLNGVILKTEYKPIARGALPALAKPETALGQELAKVLSFKPARVYFKG